MKASQLKNQIMTSNRAEKRTNSDLNKNKNKETCNTLNTEQVSSSVDKWMELKTKRGGY